jgi:hypothetical protein
MHSDSFFVQGGSHAVCQDYAEHGELKPFDDKLSYAFLSDGCSGTPHSDLVARILVRLAAASVSPALLYGQRFFGGSLSLTRRAEAAATQLGLNKKLLDATLLGVVARERSAIAMMHGDGVLVFRMKNHDQWIVAVVEFLCDGPGSFPAYPTTLDQLTIGEIEALLEQQGITNWRRRISFYGDETGTKEPYKVVEESPLRAPAFVWHPASIDSVSSITVFSDGLMTLSSGFSIDLALEATTYPVLNGAFVQRRLSSLVKKYRRLGHHFADDLSAAAVAFP